MSQKLSEEEILAQTIYSIETWQNTKTKSFFILGMVKEPHVDTKNVVIVMSSSDDIKETHKLVEENSEDVIVDIIGEWEGVDNMPDWQSHFSHFTKEIKSTYYKEEALSALGYDVEKYLKTQNNNGENND